MSMDKDQAAALREPFPAATIGKLPKPYKADSPRGNCKECGGYHGLPAVHLDYVGHAGVTDRLLKVDPEWSWEPFALDERGLPLLDQRGNMWIRLTVCGVTRIGVGDGKSLKEIIGDAIRNAAMRFGVAVDLWAKEDLHAMTSERGEFEGESVPGAPRVAQRKKPPAKPDRDAPPLPEPEPVGEPSVPMVSKPQLGKIGACMGDLGVKDRADRLKVMTFLLGREVGSTKDLTVAEARRLIDALEADTAATGVARVLGWTDAPAPVEVEDLPAGFEFGDPA